MLSKHEWNERPYLTQPMKRHPKHRKRFSLHLQKKHEWKHEFQKTFSRKEFKKIEDIFGCFDHIYFQKKVKAAKYLLFSVHKKCYDVKNKRKKEIKSCSLVEDKTIFLSIHHLVKTLFSIHNEKALLGLPRLEINEKQFYNLLQLKFKSF